ncbi:unnamed protein product, partial [Rotaria magnacalcarata]
MDCGTSSEALKETKFDINEAIRNQLSFSKQEKTQWSSTATKISTAESNFQPYGALGSISAGAVRSIVLPNNGISENVLTQLSNTISNQKIKKNSKNVTDPAMMEANNDKVNMIHGETQCTILVCTVDDGVTVAQLVYEDFISNNL